MPYEALAVNRVNAIMRGLRDSRELPQNLVFLNRTPLVNATDGEITADFTGDVFAAEIIPDDQRALTRASGKFTLEAAKLPNIKQGETLNQEMLNLMDRINAGGAIRDDEGIINRYMQNVVDRRLRAVRITMEVLRVGCALDTISWDRAGVKFTATFGTPSDLKVTPGTTWATAATATPVTDVQTLMALGREKYGENYNRLTMTSVAFRQLIATTQFRDMSAVYRQLVGITAATFPATDMARMTNIAGMMLGAQIELYDSKYYTQNNAGTTSSATNFLPDTKVILSSTANDGDGDVTDFANAVVTESIVAGLTGTNFAGGGAGGFGGPAYGPVSYVTLSSHDLNPPGVVCWGVARGMPRKRRKSAEAVLTIG